MRFSDLLGEPEPGSEHTLEPDGDRVVPPPSPPAADITSGVHATDPRSEPPRPISVFGAPMQARRGLAEVNVGLPESSSGPTVDDRLAALGPVEDDLLPRRRRGQGGKR